MRKKKPVREYYSHIINKIIDYHHFMDEKIAYKISNCYFYAVNKILAYGIRRCRQQVAAFA